MPFNTAVSLSAVVVDDDDDEGGVGCDDGRGVIP